MSKVRYLHESVLIRQLNNQTFWLNLLSFREKTFEMLLMMTLIAKTGLAVGRPAAHDEMREDATHYHHGRT